MLNDANVDVAHRKAVAGSGARAVFAALLQSAASSRMAAGHAARAAWRGIACHLWRRPARDHTYLSRGNSIPDSRSASRYTVHDAAPDFGVRSNWPSAAPASAMRRRCPALICIDVA